MAGIEARWGRRYRSGMGSPVSKRDKQEADLVTPDAKRSKKDPDECAPLTPEPLKQPRGLKKPDRKYSGQRRPCCLHSLALSDAPTPGGAPCIAFFEARLFFEAQRAMHDAQRQEVAAEERKRLTGLTSMNMSVAAMNWKCDNYVVEHAYVGAMVNEHVTRQKEAAARRQLVADEKVRLTALPAKHMSSMEIEWKCDAYPMNHAYVDWLVENHPHPMNGYAYEDWLMRKKTWRLNRRWD
ncbi:MAG: hypothetical protein OSA97_19595 [Nevskia sp.]|nr:hypothetical protein [Nevskia sp.]